MHLNVFNNKSTIGLIFIFLSGLCLLYGWYAQPFADDFCHAVDIRHQGSLLDYVLHNWHHLNGRWMTTSLRYLFESVVSLEQGYELISVLAILFIVAGNYCIACVVFAERSNRWMMTSLNTVLFIALASKLSSLLFWKTGLTDYTVAYFLFGLSVWLIYTKASWFKMVLSLLIVFFTTGLSELLLPPLGLYNFS